MESVPRQRILEARYHAWNDGLLVNELNWLGLGTVMDAVNWFRTDPDAWRILTDPLYREAGIGYVEDNGIRYLVVTLGSRPGVLPIFINDGAEITESPSVAIRLTNEDAVPFGEGTWIGKAIEVRLSNTPDFEGKPGSPGNRYCRGLWQAPNPVIMLYMWNTVMARDAQRLLKIPSAWWHRARLLPQHPLFFRIFPVRLKQLSQRPTEPTEPVKHRQHLPEETVLPETPLPHRHRVNRLKRQPPYFYHTQPTWTPLNLETPVVEETKPQDWPLILTLALQGAAVLLGIVAFLKRR